MYPGYKWDSGKQILFMSKVIQRFNCSDRITEEFLVSGKVRKYHFHEKRGPVNPDLNFDKVIFTIDMRYIGFLIPCGTFEK